MRDSFGCKCGRKHLSWRKLANCSSPCGGSRSWRRQRYQRFIECLVFTLHNRHKFGTAGRMTQHVWRISSFKICPVQRRCTGDALSESGSGHMKRHQTWHFIDIRRNQSMKRLQKHILLLSVLVSRKIRKTHRRLAPRPVSDLESHLNSAVFRIEEPKVPQKHPRLAGPPRYSGL